MNDVHRRPTDASTVTLLLRCKHSGHAVGSSDSDAVTVTLRFLLLTQPQTTTDDIWYRRRWPPRQPHNLPSLQPEVTNHIATDDHHYNHIIMTTGTTPKTTRTVADDQLYPPHMTTETASGDNWHSHWWSSMRPQMTTNAATDDPLNSHKWPPTQPQMTTCKPWIITYAATDDHLYGDRWPLITLIQPQMTSLYGHRWPHIQPQTTTGGVTDDHWYGHQWWSIRP